jgi:hypothetical protein
LFYRPDPDFAGADSFVYQVADSRDALAEAQVSIEVLRELGPPPIARITGFTNAVSYFGGAGVVELPVLRDNRIEITGTASDADPAEPVSFTLALRTPEGQELARRSGQSRTVDGPLGGFDLSTLRNGIYEARLLVQGRYQYAVAEQRFVLETGAQVGRFSFSEQDVLVPVSGFPLSVTRTYDSLHASRFTLDAPRSTLDAPRDFSPGWTYALHDVELAIDEQRQEVLDFITDEPFSLRTGGGRNVTLTLPDGRRTTFAFRLVPGPSELCLRRQRQPHPGEPAAHAARWTPGGGGNPLRLRRAKPVGADDRSAGPHQHHGVQRDWKSRSEHRRAGPRDRARLRGARTACPHHLS